MPALFGKAGKVARDIIATHHVEHNLDPRPDVICFTSSTKSWSVIVACVAPISMARAIWYPSQPSQSRAARKPSEKDGHGPDCARAARHQHRIAGRIADRTVDQTVKSVSGKSLQLRSTKVSARRHWPRGRAILRIAAPATSAQTFGRSCGHPAPGAEPRSRPLAKIDDEPGGVDTALRCTTSGRLTPAATTSISTSSCRLRHGRSTGRNISGRQVLRIDGCHRSGQRHNSCHCATLRWISRLVSTQVEPSASSMDSASRTLRAIPGQPGDPLVLLTRQDLDPLSVEELHDRIHVLEEEIARVKAKIDAAVNHRATADELFKK